MQSDKIEEVLALAQEGTKEWDDVMTRGRVLVDEATRTGSPDHYSEKLRLAIPQFQAAIRMNPGRDEGYGWLARTLRLLGQSIRPKYPENSSQCLRYACAVVWEGRSRTAAAALSVFTKQEAKALLGWVRLTRRLDPAEGEAEMEALRVEFLTTALRPDTMTSVTGG